MGLRRTLAAVATTALVCGPATAFAVPFPLSPTDPSVATKWVNPDIRTLDATSSVTSSIEMLGSGSAELSITNNSGAALSELAVRVQRAAPVTSVSAARAALAAEQSTYSVSSGFVPVNAEIAPEETHSFAVRIDTDALGITEPGVYPILLNVNGEIGSGGQQYLTSQRTLLQVGELDSRDTPLSVVVPVTANTNIVSGETGEAPGNPPLILSSEQLAQDISAQGRLTGLLDTFRGSEGVCLALDPEVVQTVSRMADGYQVATERPNPVARKPRLRDSWGTQHKGIASTPGLGAEDAKLWMTKLQAMAQSGQCLVAMPWANAELNAVAGVGNPALTSEAVNRGAPLLSQLLEVPIRGDVIIPGYGYVEKRTATALSASLTMPSTVLVAGNTMPAPVTTLDPQLKGVGFATELSALLATLGDTPATPGYANQWQRFDYRLDSCIARRGSAMAGIALAVKETKDPVLAVLPSDLQIEDATALQGQLRALFGSGRATPMSLHDVVAQPPTATAEAASTPFEDPTVVADTEMLRASQQAKSIDDLTSLMINDPNIALTPKGFTDPLRHDLLRALTANGRRTIMGHDFRNEFTDTQLNANRDILQQLRSSVVLLPPGNVYTRTSESSPLLIVAENGLPLPVDARIAYSGPEDALIEVVDSLKIPARGSITTQMMADLPDTTGRTDLTVWLASQTGAPISFPVDISVQTRSGLLSIGAVGIALLAVLGYAVFHVKRR